MTSVSQKGLAEITNWSTMHYEDEPPNVIHLRGSISGHPTIPDGETINTSQIIAYRTMPSGELVIVCFSRSYLLIGDPDPEWVKLFGEIASREGLMKYLCNVTENATQVE